jgi:hypothetical protein
LERVHSGGRVGEVAEKKPEINVYNGWDALKDNSVSLDVAGGVKVSSKKTVLTNNPPISNTDLSIHG